MLAQRGIELAEKLTDHAAHAHLLCFIAAMNLTLGDAALAILLAERALAIADAQQIGIQAVKARCVLLVASSIIGDAVESTQQRETVLRETRCLESSAVLSLVASAVGLSLIFENRASCAGAFITYALSPGESARHERWHATVLHVAAIYYAHVKQLEQCRTHLDAAASILGAAPSKRLAAELMLSRAELDACSGDIESAKSSARRAMQLLRTIRVRSLWLNAAELSHSLHCRSLGEVALNQTANDLLRAAQALRDTETARQRALLKKVQCFRNKAIEAEALKAKVITLELKVLELNLGQSLKEPCII